ncbi:MAG: ribonuclease HII [bacterium]
MKQLPIQKEIEILTTTTFVAGIDEAGRGPWAGPVVAACLVLDQTKIELIKNNQEYSVADSKKMTEKAREKTFAWLTNNFTFGVGIVEAEIIDQINILQATKLAMTQAIKNSGVKIEHLLIDAVKLPINIKQENIISGDAKVWCIAAASVIAKVTRDKIMLELHKQFPQYGFDSHKGYGTAKHQEALKNHGVSSTHRKSYQPIKELLNPQS